MRMIRRLTLASLVLVAVASNGCERRTVLDDESGHPTAETASATSATAVEDLIFAEAGRLARLVQSGDIVGIAAALPEPFIQTMGGAAAARQYIETSLSAVSVEDVWVSNRVSVTKTSREWFAIVPTSTRLRIDGTLALIDGYLLGISGDAGRTWSFVEGSSAIETIVRGWNEDAHASLQFPIRRMRLGDGDSSDGMTFLEVDGEWVLERDSLKRFKARFERIYDAASSQIYTNTLYRFSIEFPSMWQITDGTMPDTIKKAVRPGQDERSAIISVERHEDRLSPDTSWPVSGEALFKMLVASFTGVDATLQESGTSTINGEQAVWFKMELSSPIPLISKNWHFFRDGHLYVIVGVTDLDEEWFRSNARSFEEAAHSFRFLEN